MCIRTVVIQRPDNHVPPTTLRPTSSLRIRIVLVPGIRVIGELLRPYRAICTPDYQLRIRIVFPRIRGFAYFYGTTIIYNLSDHLISSLTLD